MSLKQSVSADSIEDNMSEAVKESKNRTASSNSGKLLITSSIVSHRVFCSKYEISMSLISTSVVSHGRKNNDNLCINTKF